MQHPSFADPNDGATPLWIIDQDQVETWKTQLTLDQNAWADANGFSGQLGQVCVLPGDQGIAAVALGAGTVQSRRRRRFGVVSGYAKIPAGSYALAHDAAPDVAQELALGWLLSEYRFDRYASQSAAKAKLVCPAGVDAKRSLAMAAGEYLTRDLINTPSSDMGPSELETATRALADAFGAALKVIQGDDLLAQNFPMIHTVGRASNRAPRLLDMTWGDTGPTVTLVGKGVCFDTGGLNIKPAGSMGLMKKDMGGAAHVLGLAHMIMATQMPVRLRVLIPAVENSISSNAYRPQDILTSRKGLTVEINNTDAEGRLVLADALALADETPPDLMICMATLTGAARVAVGPDLAPYYTDDEALNAAIVAGATQMQDPVWRMPFHDPYEAMIEPGIADLDNAPKGGFAGSITAALFLRRFVTSTDRFVHFDCYGWQPAAAPARPKGGAGQGTRALFDAIPKVLGL